MLEEGKDSGQSELVTKQSGIWLPVLNTGITQILMRKKKGVY